MNPGFAPGLEHARLAEDDVIAASRAQLEALRAGAGPGVDLMLDINFSARGEGIVRFGRALDDLGLAWLEADLHEPEALADARSRIATPIASCEALYGVLGYRPYLQARAADVAIVDVPWNGLWESLRIAALADAFEVNVAPHNFYGHLATHMSLHFAAAAPNLRILELEVDDVPWQGELVTHSPVVRDGFVEVPDGPGWGCDVDEAAVARHPPPRARSSGGVDVGAERHTQDRQACTVQATGSAGSGSYEQNVPVRTVASRRRPSSASRSSTRFSAARIARVTFTRARSASEPVRRSRPPRPTAPVS